MSRDGPLAPREQPLMAIFPALELCAAGRNCKNRHENGKRQPIHLLDYILFRSSKHRQIIYSIAVLDMLPVLFIGLSLTSLYMYVTAYRYEGCYRDSLSKPMFKGLGKKGPYIDLELSTGVCNEYCAGQKFAYMAVQDGRMCYCSNKLPTEIPTNNSYCDVSCSGNRFENCGGIGYNSVYATYSSEQTTSSHVSPKREATQILAGTDENRSPSPFTIGIYCLVGVILVSCILLFIYTWNTLRKKPLEESKEAILIRRAFLWSDVRSLGIRMCCCYKRRAITEPV